MRRLLARLIPLSWHKPLLFGMYGALGCVIGAGAGEALLAATRVPVPPPPPRKPHAICLVIDCSSSMLGGSIEEAKQAAATFAQRQDLQQDALGVVRFDSSASVVAPIGHQLQPVTRAIESLVANGSTAMHLGILEAVKELRAAPQERFILLFTDGVPDRPSETLAAAQTLKNNDIQLIAIGTGGADDGYLSRLTGSPDRVLRAGSGDFAAAFENANQLISGGSLVESSSATPLLKSIERIGGWTALLAIGLALALILGQNRYLRRRWLTGREALRGGIGAALAGAIAGAAGQLLFHAARLPDAAQVVASGLTGATLAAVANAWIGKAPARRVVICAVIGLLAGVFVGLILQRMFWASGRVPRLILFIVWGIIGGAVVSVCAVRSASRRGFRFGIFLAVMIVILYHVLPSYFVSGAGFARGAGRLAGWVLLGAAVGWGMSFFVANLGRGRGIVGGALGGLVGAMAFVGTGAVGNELLGRLIGAAAMGFFIGLMIAMAEVMYRELWLEVSYGPNETRLLNLGSEPVTLGSADRCTIFVKDAPALAASYAIENGQVMLDDPVGRKKIPLRPGSKQQLGAISISVCGAAAVPVTTT